MSVVSRHWEEEIRQTLGRGEIASAAVLCAKWRAEVPASIPARNLSGVVEMQRSNYLTATEFFKSALELDPNHPGSWCNLGLVYRRMGHDFDALDCLKKSAGLAPDHGGIRTNLVFLLDALAKYDEIVALLGHRQDELMAEEWWWLAKSYHALGNIPQAQEALRRSLDSYPNHAGLWQAHGDLALEIGQDEEAESAYRRTMICSPDDIASKRSLGNLLVKMGRPTEGKVLLEQAIEGLPESAEVRVEYAQSMVACGQFLDAKRVLHDVIARWPANAPAYFNLGIVEGEHGSLALGMEYARMAIEMDGAMYLAHNYQGTLLERKNAWREAEEAYRQAITLSPRFAEAHSNLGNLLARELRLDEAERYYREAIRLKPDLVEAHHNLGLLLLLDARFENAWNEYEWRWKTTEGKRHVRAFSKPEWRGENVAGKRLLVHAEQGYGDSIQFVRYMEQLRAQGAEIFFEAPPPLRRLMETARGIDRLVTQGEPIPEFDFHIPLLNVPGVVGANLENLPTRIPYLSSTEENRSKWVDRLAALGPGLRVGIAWAGSAKHGNDQFRSIPASELSALAAVEGIHWVSLYKPTPRAQVSVPHCLRMITFIDHAKDYADTAALVDLLDLVISVDTSVAHLAGALGKPTWVLLPFAPDWRWLLRQDTSPWYPTARLYRQRSVDEGWEKVLSRVATDLPA